MIFGTVSDSESDYLIFQPEFPESHWPAGALAGFPAGRWVEVRWHGKFGSNHDDQSESASLLVSELSESATVSLHTSHLTA